MTRGHGSSRKARYRRTTVWVDASGLKPSLLSTLTGSLRAGRRSLPGTGCRVEIGRVLKAPSPRCLVVDFGSSEPRWSTAYDVAQRIEQVRAAGHHVVCFSDTLSTGFLIAAAPATTRVVPPLAGPLDWGMERTTWDLTRLAERLGGATPYHPADSGKPHSRALTGGMSPEAVERLRTMVRGIDKRAASFLRSHLAHETVDRLTRDAFPTAVELADTDAVEVGYRGTVAAKAIRVFDTERYGQRATRDRVARRYPRPRTQRLIEVSVNGPLLRAHGLSRALVEAAQSPRCAGILLTVSCAAGRVSAADEVATVLQYVREEVPVVAYILEAESAGYVVASSASQVVINPFGTLGAVGSVSWGLDFPGLLSRLGIDRESIRASDAVSKVEAHAARAALADKLMTARVRAGRRGASEGSQEGEELSMRDVLNADNALQLGLADAIGGVDQAIGVLSRLAGSAEPLQVADGADLWARLAQRAIRSAFKPLHARV